MSTGQLIKKSNLSRIISTVTDLHRTQSQYPRPGITWKLNSSTNNINLRLRFSSLMQKDSYIPVLSKLTISHNPKLPSNEIEIDPIENGEDSQAILSQIIHSLWDKIMNRNMQISRGPRRKLIVEFGSPNIAKPLHMGHLRSTVTGHFIARILKAGGNDVVSMCYLGDWGTQFGLVQAALSKWGNPSEISTLDLNQLLGYYVRAVKQQETDSAFGIEARGFSAALEKGDPSALSVWSYTREKTLEHLHGVWKQLGIQYDVVQAESDFSNLNESSSKTIEILRENGLTETGPDGCIYAITPSGNVPIIKADGSSLYLSRDIGAAFQRKETHGFDHCIYVVDKRQSNHFTALFSILSQIGFQSPSASESILTISDNPLPCVSHISFGQVSGMSTRGGTAVLISDVLQEGSKLMQENRLKSPNARNVTDETISTHLAISSLIVHFLRAKRNKDIKFDWTEALRSIGDTGVRLQYTHSRLVSLEKVVGEITDFGRNFSVDYVMGDKVALDLALHLASFESAIISAYDELEASILLGYLFKLCEKTSKGLKCLPVSQESDVTIKETRLLLFILARRALAVGMDLIGIEALEEI